MTCWDTHRAGPPVYDSRSPWKWYPCDYHGSGIPVITMEMVSLWLPWKWYPCDYHGNGISVITMEVVSLSHQYVIVVCELYVGMGQVCLSSWCCISCGRCLVGWKGVNKIAIRDSKSQITHLLALSTLPHGNQCYCVLPSVYQDSLSSTTLTHARSTYKNNESVIILF